MNADEHRSNRCSSAFICGLFCIQCRNEAGAVAVITCFPDHDDLIHRDVAILSVIITKVRHTRFHLQHFTTQARRTSAKNIDLLPDKP